MEFDTDALEQQHQLEPGALHGLRTKRTGKGDWQATVTSLEWWGQGATAEEAVEEVIRGLKEDD